MTVTYKQFQSTDGFSSPGYTVDSDGNLTAASINSLGSLLIGGLPFISGSSLANSITGSNLQTLGQLNSLHAGNDGTSNDIFTVNNFGISSSALSTVNLAGGLLNIDPTNLPNAVNIGSVGSTLVSLNVSGTLYINSNTESTSSTTGSVQVAGGVGIAKTLNVGTDAYIAGNMYVAGQNVKSLAAALAVALS